MHYLISIILLQIKMKSMKMNMLAVGGVQGGGNQVSHTFDLNGEVVEEDE